jgi:hypothetical protein
MAAEAASAQILEGLFGAAGSSTGGLLGSGGLGAFFSSLLPGLAAGTDFARGGPTIVGERGPEIVQMPRGARVTPIGQGGFGSVAINVNVAANATEGTRRAAGQIGRDIAAQLNRDLRRNG